jgi:Ca2+-transporting ATPase
MTGAWHAADVREVTARLASDLAHGLEPGEAAARLERDGPNEIRRAREISPLAIFANQFRSLVIWVLLGAAVVAVGLGELVDGVAIVAIVLLNAVIGFFQEYRAEHAVAALARLAAPRCRVVRGGRTKVVPARDVVRGDVVLLEAGDLVPADARLGEAASLRTNEAALTGESQPVEKAVEIHAPDTPLADRRNMVFLGTSVAGGTGRAVVVAAGMATEVGRIATLLESASSDETPLQRKLDLVARRLLWASLAIVLRPVRLQGLGHVRPWGLRRTR